MRNRQSAFSIVEVIIALAIMGVVSGTVVTLITNKYHEQRLNLLRIAKDRIVRQVEDGAMTLENLQLSQRYMDGPNALNNAFMMTCMTRGAICPKEYVGQQNLHPFDLVAPGKLGYTRLSGYWSKDGVPNCDPPFPEYCPFVVRTYFYFSCPLNATGVSAIECKSPSRLNLLVQVQPNEPIKYQNRGFNFYYPLPNGDISNPAVKALSVATDRLRDTKEQFCLPDQYIEGYDQAGSALCACYNHRPKRDAGGNVIRDTFNRPTCSDDKCPPSEKFIGYKFDAPTGDWVPECQSLLQVDCYPINLQNASCQSGYYLAKANLNACGFVPFRIADKKSVRVEMRSECTQDSGMCCRGNF